jgi:hypothetical protein
MGDSGEGLIDEQSRIEERRDEMERARGPKPARVVRDPEKARALETLRLARKELECQFACTHHERRRAQIAQAIQEIDRRMAETAASAPA